MRDLVTVTGLLFAMAARDPKMALGALLALPVAGVLQSKRNFRGASANFARCSYEGSTQIVQTMGVKPCWARRIVRSFNLGEEMRERMSRLIRTVERLRPTGSPVVGGGLATLLSPTRFRRLRDRFRHFLRLVARRGSARRDVGAFASFLGALLLAYEPAIKRISRFPVDIQNGLVGARSIWLMKFWMRRSATRRTSVCPKLRGSRGPRRDRER